VDQKDYYQTLGVDANASPQQVREGYRKLAFQFHPDRNKESLSAAEKMKELNEAYAVLSNARKRREYDDFRQRFGTSAYGQFRQSYNDRDIFRGSDINQILEEMGKAFGLRGFNDVFTECYGPECQTFEFRRPGVFGRGFVFVKSARNTGGEAIRFPLGGNLGKLGKYVLKKISGLEWPERGKDWEEAIRVDPIRAWMGGEIRYHHQRRARNLIVKLPPRVREGQRIRLKGMGAEGKGGGAPGDLYLKVRFKNSITEKVKEGLRRILSSFVSFK